MRTLLLTAWLLIFSISQGRAGDEKFQLTLMLSPTAEYVRFGQSLNAGVYNRAWGTKLSYNFGIEYKRFFDPSLSFTTGVMYMNKGFRNLIYEVNDQGVLETSEAAGATLGNIHIAAVPLYLNVHHRLRRKVEMIYTAGLAGGYVFSERIRNNYYSGEVNPEQGFLDLSEEGASNVNLFVDYYVGAHFGVGISAYFKRSFLLIVQPTYRMQLNNARDYAGQFNSGDPFTVRLNSFGIDVKVGYFFTKQIRDRKKNF